MLTPPLLTSFVKALGQRLAARRRAPEWQYCPAGWQATQRDPSIKGWNHASVLETYRQHWLAFRERLDGTQPLDLCLEQPARYTDNPVLHNIVMTFAYVLTLTARRTEKISLLDWGGNLGHYYLLAKALLPDLEIDYHCRDVELLAHAGRTNFPDQHFYWDDSCLDRQYDLVLASGSLQFSEHWQETLGKLARAARGYLYVTNIPTVQTERSFVFVQRPYSYGYATEFLAWCFSKDELIQEAGRAQQKLVREFVIGHRPEIVGAPEQNVYRGFLFQPATDA